MCDVTLADCHFTYGCAVERHHGGKQSGLIHRAAVWFDDPTDPTKRIPVEIRFGNSVPKPASIEKGECPS